VPGKEEFHETLRYFGRELSLSGVALKLGTRVAASDLEAFDRVVLATGVSPRALRIEGAEHPKVVSYYDVLTRRAGSGEHGAGRREQRGGRREHGAASSEQGARSRAQGAGSGEQGAGCREQGAGSREQGAGSRVQGGVEECSGR
jgi:hypothetical protein